jgi:hypothetical protein
MLLTNYGFERGWAVFTGRNDKIFHRHENSKNLDVVRLKSWNVEKLGAECFKVGRL